VFEAVPRLPSREELISTIAGIAGAAPASKHRRGHWRNLQANIRFHLFHDRWNKAAA